MSETNKDVMILFASVAEGYNSKKNDLNPQGGRRVTLTLKADQAQALANELLNSIANSPTQKAKVDIHITKKQTEEGRTFSSGIAFVRPGQEFGAKASGSAPTKKFVSASSKTMKA